MKKSSFDYYGAKEAGLSDEDILTELSSAYPDYDVKGALDAGLTHSQINEYLSDYKPERSLVEKGARLGAQTAIGLLQATPAGMVYETGAIAAPHLQYSINRENIFEDISELEGKKQSADLGIDKWEPQDEELLIHLKGLIKQPEKLEKFSGPEDIGIRALAEKATGVDLEPEGVLEHAANWIGFLKDPKKGYNLLKNTFKNPSEGIKILKEAIPGTKSLRALGAGAALEMAEQGQFGPIGTIGAAIVGDILGHSPKAALSIARNPQRAAAELVNLVTRGNSQKKWIEQIAQDAKDAGIQLDAGTLTNSNLVKMAQARASQSALSGTALDNFRKDLSNQFIREYQNIAEQVGENLFENNHQAAEAIKQAIKVEEAAFPEFANTQKEAGRSLKGRVSVEERPLYQQELLQRISPQEFPNDYVGGETLKIAASDIKVPIKEEFNRRWNDFNEMIGTIVEPQAELAGQLQRFIAENEGSLLLGESTAEYRSLQAAQNLLEQLQIQGDLQGVSLMDLVKTKRTLADVANWEVGTSDFSSRFKELVGNIDAAIDRTLERIHPELREVFERLNADYSQFKDLFENKNVRQLFEPKNENYNSIYRSYVNNPDKFRSLEDMLITSPRGQEILNQVKRDIAQEITSKPNLTQREFNNLSQTLGPDFDEALTNYYRQRQFDIENPVPRPAQQSRLGLTAQAPETQAVQPLGKGRVKESDFSSRKRLHKFLEGKDADQIMKQMDSIDGIRRLKSVLNQTPEGQKLFKDLSRYKLEEMIGNKMTGDLKENVKLGTFSNLLKTTKNKAIVKELLGEQSYNKLRRLQKLGGVLQESAGKFFNASQSGTTVGDVALISTGITGVITGNPFMALGSLASFGGMRVAAHLLSDPKFLGYLEQAVLSNDKEKFLKILEKMKPIVEDAVKASRGLISSDQT